MHHNNYFKNTLRLQTLDTSIMIVFYMILVFMIIDMLTHSLGPN